MNTSGTHPAGVGPALHATPFARSELLRLSRRRTRRCLSRTREPTCASWSPGCRLSRAGLEAATGFAIRFPGDLELVMSSFSGVIELTEDSAVWRLAREPSAQTAVPMAGGR